MNGLLERLPSGECRSCGAAVPYLARRCPDCGAGNLPNPVATATALLAVLLIGGISTLGVLGLRHWRTQSSNVEARPAASETAARNSNGETATDDYGWIVKAMAECEEEAKLKSDTLHFLIVPVTMGPATLMGWSPTPISPIGESAVLLNSTDTMIGLRNRVLALYRKPLTFAVTDPATRTVYKWRPASGVTVLKTRETGSRSLTLGLEIQDETKDVEWGPTINLNKGTCYWINPMVRPRTRNG